MLRNGARNKFRVTSLRGERDIHHPAALLSATLTRSLSPAPSPSSPAAFATAAVAMAGLKPRFCKAETASTLVEPGGDATAPTPAALGSPPALSFSPLTRSDTRRVGTKCVRTLRSLW